MSFILDALKKSESERNRQSGPVLLEVRVAPPRSRLPAWAIVLGIARLANALVLGYLLLRYTALLFGVALKYLKDKNMAEDAVQQVFMKVLTHMPQEDIHNFKGWLYILMRNHCLQQLRDKSHNADQETLIQTPATETDREELRWHDHTLQQMEEAIALLNEEQ